MKRAAHRPERSPLGSLASSGALDAAFRDALQLLGVGASGLLLGCGGDAEPWLDGATASGRVLRDASFAWVACEPAADASRRLLLADLSPADPLDYLELRSTWTLDRQSVGTLCGGSSDAVDCRARFAALPEQPALPYGQLIQIPEFYHLQATRGDQVLRAGTLPELRALLGDVNTLGEAALFIESQNYHLACGESGGVRRGTDFWVIAFTFQGCDGRTRHLLDVDGAGTLRTIESFVEREADPGCSVGRRPEGYAGARVRPSSLGAFLASCAELEAASVPAFVRLARELAAHGAPRELVGRALSSARDEVRHAQAVGALARRFGGEPSWPRVPVGGVRSLQRVALENAVEGCVRETYGALVAHHQARAASDESIANAYRDIAVDETRHAELSWDVARWAERRLPSSERRQVTAARRAGASALMATLARSTGTPLDEVAGLPPPAAGAALAERLGASLWRDGDVV